MIHSELKNKFDCRYHFPFNPNHPIPFYIVLGRYYPYSKVEGPLTNKIELGSEMEPRSEGFGLQHDNAEQFALWISFNNNLPPSSGNHVSKNLCGPLIVSHCLGRELDLIRTIKKRELFWDTGAIAVVQPVYQPDSLSVK